MLTYPNQFTVRFLLFFEGFHALAAYGGWST